MSNDLFLPSLQTRKLSDFLRDEFFNREIQKELSRVMESIFDEDFPIWNMKVRRYINTFGKITNHNDKHYSFSAGINGIPNMFQIDTSGNFKKEILMRWARIAFNITNKLREDIPNFQYLYNVFESKGRMRIFNGNVLEWQKNPEELPDDEPIGIIITREYIPGETMDYFISKCNPDIFLQIFFQVCLALNMANKLHNYISGSIKDESVIIRDLGKEYVITYRIPGISIVTRYLVVITETSTQPPDKDFFKDIRRFFMNCSDSDLLSQEMEHFFNIYSGIDFSFDFDLYEKNIKGFLGLFESPNKNRFFIPDLNVGNLNVGPLNCNNFPCKKREDLEYPSWDLPINNFLDLYELKDIKGIGVITELKETVNFSQLLKNSLEDIEKLFGEVEILKSQLWRPDIRNSPNPTMIYEIGNYKRFVSEINQVGIRVIKIKNLLQYIRDYLIIIEYLASETSQPFDENKIKERYIKGMKEANKMYEDLKDISRNTSNQAYNNTELYLQILRLDYFYND